MGEGRAGVGVDGGEEEPLGDVGKKVGVSRLDPICAFFYKPWGTKECPTWILMQKGNWQ